MILANFFIFWLELGYYYFARSLRFARNCIQLLLLSSIVMARFLPLFRVMGGREKKLKVVNFAEVLILLQVISERQHGLRYQRPRMNSRFLSCSAGFGSEFLKVISKIFSIMTPHRDLDIALCDVGLESYTYF